MPPSSRQEPKRPSRRSPARPLPRDAESSRPRPEAAARSPSPSPEFRSEQPIVFRPRLAQSLPAGRQSTRTRGRSRSEPSRSRIRVRSQEPLGLAKAAVSPNRGHRPVRSTTSAAMTTTAAIAATTNALRRLLRKLALTSGSATGVSSSSCRPLPWRRHAPRGARRRGSRRRPPCAPRTRRQPGRSASLGERLRRPALASARHELGVRARRAGQRGGERRIRAWLKREIADASSFSSGSGEKDSARPPVARRRSCREVRRLSNPGGG